MQRKIEMLIRQLSWGDISIHAVHQVCCSNIRRRFSIVKLKSVEICDMQMTVDG